MKEKNSIIQQSQNRASSHDMLEQQGQIVPLAILPVLIDTAPPPLLHTLGAGTCSTQLPKDWLKPQNVAMYATLCRNI